MGLLHAFWIDDGSAAGSSGSSAGVRGNVFRPAVVYALPFRPTGLAGVLHHPGCKEQNLDGYPAHSIHPGQFFHAFRRAAALLRHVYLAGCAKARG